MTLSGEVPVSVCTYRQSQNEEHWLVMMESVERVSASLSFSQDVSTSLFSSLGSGISLFFFAFFMRISAFFKYMLLGYMTISLPIKTILCYTFDFISRAVS